MQIMIGESSSTDIGVELAHEGGEAAVLEVQRQQVGGELRGLPDDEGGTVLGPRDHLVRPGVLHHPVRLRQERRRRRHRPPPSPTPHHIHSGAAKVRHAIS